MAEIDTAPPVKQPIDDGTNLPGGQQLNNMRGPNRPNGSAIEDILARANPILPINGWVPLPGFTYTLSNVGLAQSVSAVQQAQRNGDGYLILAIKKNPRLTDIARRGDLLPVGVLAKLTDVTESWRGPLKISLQILSRVNIASVDTSTEGEVTGNVNLRKGLEETAGVEGLAQNLRAVLAKYLKNKGWTDLRIDNLKLDTFRPARLAYFAYDTVTDTSDAYDKSDAYEVLAADNLESLLEDAIARFPPRTPTNAKGASTIKAAPGSKEQEQKREIIPSNPDGDLAQYLAMLEDKKPLMPVDAIKHLEKLLGRFAKLPENSHETEHVRKQIELSLELPWNMRSTYGSDLAGAKSALEEKVSGMVQAKEALLDHLAVHIFFQKRGKMPQGAPILCLVGPPGTGKTALAKAAAIALGQRFQRVALGGVSDENEIRGHRATYIGSAQGRILDAMKKAGVANPVLLLDELDKMGRDRRGDPGAALLEVLDPEQNNEFRDAFLGIPYDLSGVTFIATANYVESIEPALRDRLEILYVEGYGTDEKILIAKKHLVPAACGKVGLEPDQITIEDEALRNIVTDYTMEEGVRKLQDCVEKIARKVVRAILENRLEENLHVQVTCDNLSDYLGPPRDSVKLQQL